MKYSTNKKKPTKSKSTAKKPASTKKRPAGTVQIHPENGGKVKTTMTAEAIGSHYIVRTPLVLKGRGITPNDTNPTAKTAPKLYKVTKKAYEKLEKEHRITQILWFD